MKITSKKAYQIGFAVLVLINASLIFLLVRQGQRPPRSHGSRNTSIIEKVSNRLALTEDQLMDYRLMANQHGEQMRKLESDHRSSIKAYFETLSNKSTRSADSLKKEILKIESEKLQITYDHFAALRALLSEQQQDQFEPIIKEILAVLMGERNRFRPPPEGGDRRRPRP